MPCVGLSLRTTQTCRGCSLADLRSCRLSDHYGKMESDRYSPGASAVVFRLVVKNAPSRKRFVWEIVRDDLGHVFLRSPGEFGSMEDAYASGSVALKIVHERGRLRL